MTKIRMENEKKKKKTIGGNYKGQRKRKTIPLHHKPCMEEQIIFSFLQHTFLIILKK
jgi:hypothetical protein